MEHTEGEEEEEETEGRSGACSHFPPTAVVGEEEHLAKRAGAPEQRLRALLVARRHTGTAHSVDHCSRIFKDCLLIVKRMRRVFMGTLAGHKHTLRLSCQRRRCS